MGKTSNAVKDRWKAENYSRVTVYLPKEDAEKYKAKCSENNLAISEIPKTAMLNFINEK